MSPRNSSFISNISIHAAREGGDFISTRIFIAVSISIHAAREGGDDAAGVGAQKNDISIHAAREGGDCSTGGTAGNARAFQSTPPVKAATQRTNRLWQFDGDFNPRRP